MSSCPQGAWSKLFKRSSGQPEDLPEDDAKSWATWAQKYTPGWPSALNAPGWLTVPAFVHKWGLKTPKDKKDP